MSEPISADAIAIVGMAGRFGAAQSVPEFWRALCDGRELITRYSREELLLRGVPESMLDHPDYVAARGAIRDPLGFDAQFFGYSPREAQLMDPQQRILLETAWHVVEDAGESPVDLHGTVAVFAATAPSTYLRTFPPPASADSLEVQLGNDSDFAAARVSYKLGLDGPSIGVSTACSSGLTAIHLACQSLLTGDADTALALAASVRFPADRGLIRVPGSILSADGHCRPFAVDADGTVEADGSAGVMLRRLDDALANGDRVYAVILGSAIGNDGNARVGFTAPGVEGQRRVVQAALQYAETEAAEVGYVEAHGTGTRLGDPVETRALAAVYGDPDRREPCRFGSLKSNVGHLNHVAGLAGLIKIALSVESGTIPPCLHLEGGTNPDLDLASGRLQPQTALAPWPEGYQRRVGAVSSFGMGGSGVHVVVTTAPAVRAGTVSTSAGPVLLPLSARSPEALAQVTARLADWFESNPDCDMRDVGFTLAHGRTPMRFRTAVLVSTPEEAVSALAAAVPSQVPLDSSGGTGVIFPGQGAEHAGAAASAYDDDAQFRSHLDACLDSLPALERARVRAYLLDAGIPERGTELAQPALFAMEYAKARCWEAEGLEWSGMLGHSVGEFAAACLAGVLSMEDAMRLVAARGRLASTTGPGSMLAVRLPMTELHERLAGFDGWDLAAHNAEDEFVLSGTVAALCAIEAELQSARVTTLRVEATHAFHSRLLDPVVAEYRDVVQSVTLRAPHRPYMSCVTGDWVTADQAVSVEHWVEQMRGTVRFATAMRTALDSGLSVFVQLGPGQMATSGVRRARARAVVVSGEGRSVRSGLGQAWANGAVVRWPDDGHKVGLPGYPFEHQQYVTRQADATEYVPESATAAGIPQGVAAAGAVTQVPLHSYSRSLMDTVYRDPGTGLEAQIVQIVEEMLETRGIGADDDFFDFGWDSLLSVALAARLSRVLGFKVDADLVYDASTAALLAAALVTQGADATGADVADETAK